MFLKRILAFSIVIFSEPFKKEIVYDTKSRLRHIYSWLRTAQDVTNNGGVSAYYSITEGWAPAFIETTGYIIGSFIRYAQMFDSKDATQRALKMSDFLLKMQMSSGAFKAYVGKSKKARSPVIFNVGQDLLGICDAYVFKRKKSNKDSIVAAADYLVSCQNSNGSWTEVNYGGNTHAYHSRVALALIKASQVTHNKQYLTSARKALAWVMSCQQPNGWFERAELPGFSAVDPITHTLAYTLEGLLFAAIALKDKKYISSVERTLKKIVQVYTRDGQIWATYNSSWKPTARYVCLTGSAQIACLCWTMYAMTRSKIYLDAAQKLTNFLCKAQTVKSMDAGIIGGIAGSYPILGDIIANEGYCRLAYPNWAAKFFMDALMHKHLYELHALKSPWGKYVYS